MNIFQGFRKLLFCVIAACTGMVVGYQLSRVLFANVRLCLGIGAVCAVRKSNKYRNKYLRIANIVDVLAA